ncbi:hypothetical protein WJX74_000669 [Apatococcus lobatus]|uniref:guanylate cyclase n=1 Tax=Apatococcus lobatus TaxID=904363 RepID=A0AAW1SDH7_9CHLO
MLAVALPLLIAGLLGAGPAAGQPVPPPTNTTPTPSFRVGVQGILGQQFLDTLGPYLSSATPYSFEAVTYDNDTVMLQDARAGNLNFTFAGPVQYLCLSLAATTSDGVAELVSASYIDGAPVERLAGAVVVLSGSPVRAMAGLAGRVVLAGPISSLTTFAAQWQAVQAGGLDLFRDTAGVFLKSNLSQILPDLLAGVGDVAFVPSSYIERFYPNTSFFRVVGDMNTPGFPYARSTPLYPNVLLSALDSTRFEVRRSVAEALFAIQPNSSLATAAMYNGFTPLGAYTAIRTLMASLGLLDSQTQCRTITGLIDLITCPPGFVRKAAAATCTDRPCPPGYQCACSPCTPVRASERVAGLSVAAFTVVFGLLGALAALVAFVLVRLLVLRRHFLPFAALHVDPAVPLGASTHGLVLRGVYGNQQVAVKRAFPRTTGSASVFDQPGVGDGRRWFPSQAWLALSRLLECFWVVTRDRRDVRSAFRRARLQHSNIMPCLGVSRSPRGEVLVVMPLMEAGTIADLLNNKQYDLEEQTVRAIATDVAGAVLHLHAYDPPVVGKNLKPHHLLLDGSWRTLLGLSFRPPNLCSVWAPPEVLRGGPWTPAGDAYAFAMLLYTLLHRHPPFQGRVSVDLLEALRDAGDDPGAECRPVVEGHGPLHDLVRACWQEDPAHRPTFSRIRETLAFSRASRVPRHSFSVHYQGEFPDTVRRLLDEGKPVPSTHHPRVTVFFSDIEGFTDIARALQPELVQAMLNALYLFMDRCARVHGIHKMETIGDSWMGVTNLMREQPDHAARMARFALDIAQGAGDIPVNAANPDGPHIRLRMGMHTGPVVSGVAGSLNVRFCLFGNAVNLASRMESTGEAGRIQMTPDTAAEVRADRFLAGLVRRRAGLVDVKGQGKMRTFWLRADSPSQSRRSLDESSDAAFHVIDVG